MSIKWPHNVCWINLVHGSELHLSWCSLRTGILSPAKPSTAPGHSFFFLSFTLWKPQQEHWQTAPVWTRKSHSQAQQLQNCCHCLLLFSPCRLPLHHFWDSDRRYFYCSSVFSFQNNHLNNTSRESAAAPLLLAVLKLSQWSLSRSRVSSWQNMQYQYMHSPPEISIHF